MNYLLLFKISITAIVLYGDASSNNIDIIALEDTIKHYLDQTFQTILANKITHNSVKETELKEKDGEEMYSMKEKPENLLVIRRITSRANMNSKKNKKNDPQNYFEERNKKIQKEANLRRIRKLIEFMKNNVESTNYFHSEVQRIKRDRQVMDEIRKMIHIADETTNKTYAKAINICYDLVVEDKEIDLYADKMHNLVIEIPTLTHV